MYACNAFSIIFKTLMILLDKCKNVCLSSFQEVFLYPQVFAIQPKGSGTVSIGCTFALILLCKFTGKINGIFFIDKIFKQSSLSII